MIFSDYTGSLDLAEVYSLRPSIVDVDVRLEPGEDVLSCKLAESDIY